MPESRRIGIFGGTFNPIHNGHLSACRQVCRKLELQRVYFIPSALPPHKGTRQLAAGHHRLAMIGLALDQDPCLRASDLELKRPGPSFSIDTVRSVKAASDENTCLYFIIGLDAFLSLHTWRSWRQLLAETCMAVMSRPFQEAQSAGDFVKQLETYLCYKLSLAYEYHPEEECFKHPVLMPVYPVEVTPVDVSSSRVRECLRKGLPVETMVPEAVAAYIKNKGLYR